MNGYNCNPMHPEPVWYQYDCELEGIRYYRKTRQVLSDGLLLKELPKDLQRAMVFYNDEQYWNWSGW